MNFFLTLETRLAVSAFAALRAFVPPAADAHSPALRASAAAAAGTVAAVSSALPASAADEYLNYNMTGGAHLETRHIFQDLIFHFHDYGRKGSTRYPKQPDK